MLSASIHMSDQPVKTEVYPKSEKPFGILKIGELSIFIKDQRDIQRLKDSLKNLKAFFEDLEFCAPESSLHAEDYEVMYTVNRIET